MEEHKRHGNGRGLRQQLLFLLEFCVVSLSLVQSRLTRAVRHKRKRLSLDAACVNRDALSGCRSRCSCSCSSTSTWSWRCGVSHDV